MIRQGRRKVHIGAALVAALMALVALPAGALASIDAPLAPVTVDAADGHGLGLLPSPEKTFSASTIERMRAQSVTLPGSVDLTPWAIAPGNQGSVNSCAAWATGYTALGYYLKRQNIAGDALAPMYTYSQLVNGQNVGTHIDDHLSIAKSQGVDSWADYTQGAYDYTHKPTAAETANAAHWVISGYEDLPIAMGSPSVTTTQVSIETALAAGKPVVLGIPVWANFYSVSTTNHGYYGGISGAFQGYHAVTALGYDASGVRIENSWGPYWGDGGFATLGWGWVNQYVNWAVQVDELISSSSTPTALASPYVTGATVRGGTLTASTGRFTASPTSYAYQWQHDTAGNGAFADISGATSSTYVPTSDDVTDKLRVVVTAANGAGSASSTSAAVGPVTPAAPSNTTAPAITGTTARGATLSVTHGDWTDNPASYTYQWQRAATTTYASITGATAASYVPTSADVAMNLRVLVSAKNATGTGTTYSNVAGPIAKAPPTNSDVPTVAGTAARGSVLTSALGSWGGVGNAYAYQWQRDPGTGFVAITGATAANYTVQLADEGAKLRVRVTATNVDGSLVAYSDSTDAVAKAPPVNSSVPSPTGTAARSGVLTAAVGSWAGAGNAYTYQWQRDGGSGYVAITGATAVTYTLQAADEGANVRVRVTGTNADGSAAAYSEGVGPIAKTPPANSVVPVVTGTAARAATLAATAGTWTAVGNTYAFQWQRSTDGDTYADIAGATKSTYLLTQADEGATVRVKVTATNVDGSVAAYSSATVTVAKSPPANAIAPVVTGTAARTAKLTASTGNWTGAGNAYTFQWQREADGETEFSDIAGATASTYTLTADDEGAKVRIEVTGTNVDDAVAAYSAPTAPVGKVVPVQTAAPVASGTARTSLTLSATTGSWTPAGSTYAYQWQRDTGSGFTSIDGATAATYVLTDDDAGAKVRAQVTATNVDGSTNGYTNALGPVLATPHTSDAPAITGTLNDAQTLTASTGTWVSAGNLAHTYKYEWIRCPSTAATATSTGCKSIAPASASATYATVAADVGTRLAVRVTATNTQNVAASAVSGVTDVLVGRELTLSTAPAISADQAMVHYTQTANAGTWSVPLTSAAYQWRRCDADGANCVDITGAKAATYVPVVADTGKTLTVHVSVTSPGRTATADSDPTDAIQALPLPTGTTAVTVRGTAARLQTLTMAGPAAWNAFPTAFAYAWQRCDENGDNCAAIAGASKTTYVPTVADEGHTLRAAISATNTTGTGTSTSEPTAAVAAVAPASTAAPAIAGSAVVGQTLTASKGTWTAPADTVFTYAWLRCGATGDGCAAIVGATAATYKPVAADVDGTLKVTVTATNPDGHPSATSAATAKVKPAPPAATVRPVLSGTAQVGKTLTVTAGTWTGTSSDPAATFYRCTTTCTAVGHDKTYVLASADAGAKIKASVTGTGAGGSTEVYAATILGPVTSATAGTALVGVGAPVSLKSSTGAVLAKATVAGAAGAAGTMTVTVKAASRLKGAYKVWACPAAATGADWQPCTSAAKLSAKGAHLRVALDAGERVRVVVAKKK